MNEDLCLQRLLASATHDMRNVLAVIRESAGLSSDLIQYAENLSPQTVQERLARSMVEVQQQVRHGAELIEGIECLCHALKEQKEPSAAACDLSRLIGFFCLLMARHARAARLTLQAEESQEPIWAQSSVLAVWQALLKVCDLCSSVGGKVQLSLSAQKIASRPCIVIDVTAGENQELVLAAMTNSPFLSPLEQTWTARLFKTEQRQRFYLSVSTENES